MMFYDMNWFQVLHSIGMITTTMEFAITFQMTVLIQIPLLYIFDHRGGVMQGKKQKEDLPYYTYDWVTERTEDHTVTGSICCLSERDGRRRSDGTIDYNLD
jgi:hypothetical protein